MKLSKKQIVKQIILSIKPQYVNEIIAGNKRFEYRRSIFKNKDIDTVVIYCSFPVKKIIGEFKIKSIYKKEPQQLWQETKLYAGISEKSFFEYFKNKEFGYALEIDELEIYDSPLDIYETYKVKAPQSFCYIK